MSVSVEKIIRIVSEEYGVSVVDIKSDRRDARIVAARQAACWLARNYTTASLPRIGKALGNRDHTTILHAVRKISELDVLPYELVAARDRIDVVATQPVASVEWLVLQIAEPEPEEPEPEASPILLDAPCEPLKYTPRVWRPARLLTVQQRPRNVTAYLMGDRDAGPSSARVMRGERSADR